jgi:hypothetical protein
MFYGWHMTGNVFAGKVAIQNVAMNIQLHQFLSISLSHPLSCSLAFYRGREHSEPRSEHAGSFILCRALLDSGLPPWLHIEIT